MKVWKYIGNGSFLPGIPARDLSDDEVILHGKGDVIASGLYEIPKNAPEPKPIKATEEVTTSWQE